VRERLKQTKHVAYIIPELTFAWGANYPTKHVFGLAISTLSRIHNGTMSTKIISASFSMQQSHHWWQYILQNQFTLHISIPLCLMELSSGEIQHKTKIYSLPTRQLLKQWQR